MAAKDLVMMQAAHQAFRRDLRALAAAPDLDRWRRFSGQLSTHHTAEDIVLWPRMRRRGVDAALLDAMEAEHEQIDPLLRAVAAAFDTRDRTAQHRHLTDLSTLLDEHLRHEEAEILPLISEAEWSALDREIRRRLGIRGVRPYFAWVLEDAPTDLRRQVLDSVPPPVRLLIR